MFSRQSTGNRSADSKGRVSPSAMIAAQYGKPHNETVPMRLGGAADLKAGVTQFLALAATTNAMGAEPERRRQLLVLRDHCVSTSRAAKERELLSQGGKSISKKTPFTTDFNCCLGLIFAASLQYAEPAELTKQTFRAMLQRLIDAQNTCDEAAYRAAIVDVVCRILQSTPLTPPVTEKLLRHTKVDNANGVHPRAEPRLRDECLDFMMIQGGTVTILEKRWRRWRHFLEAGYNRYVEKVLDEQASGNGERAGAADSEEETNAPQIVPPVVEALPVLYFSPTRNAEAKSAYAQFCQILLSVFFVRTRDFSLNYLARVTKLVQYFHYHLEKKDGAPVRAREAPSDSDSGDEVEASMEVIGRLQPQYDESTTRHTRNSIVSEHPSMVTVAPAASKPRRRGHKCYETDELPEDLRPSQNAIDDDARNTSETPWFVQWGRRTQHLGITPSENS